MFKMLAALFIVHHVTHAALPPTTLKGNSETTRPTTYHFQVPMFQATTTAAQTRRIETGNTNLLVNPSFEATTASSGWTLQSGVSASTLTPSVDNQAINLTLTAVNGVVISQTLGSLGGSFHQQELTWAIWYQTASANFKMCVYNGLTQVGCVPMPATSGSATGLYRAFIPFLGMNASSNLIVTVETTASTTDTIALDAGYVGVSTGDDYGAFAAVVTATTTNCFWLSTATGSLQDFPADTDCPVPAVYGLAAAPGTRIPAITFPYFPAGYYIYEVTGALGANRSGGGFGYNEFVMHDGGSGSSETALIAAEGTSFSPQINFGMFNPTDRTNVTVRVRARMAAASINNQIDAQNCTFTIKVFRYSAKKGALR